MREHDAGPAIDAAARSCTPHFSQQWSMVLGGVAVTKNSGARETMGK
jgi:hypothetical protein